MFEGRPIRFRQSALDKLEREGVIGGTHEDDAEQVKHNIATFLRTYPGDEALIQPSPWSNHTLRLILNVNETFIEVADVEVLHPRS